MAKNICSSEGCCMPCASWWGAILLVLGLLFLLRDVGVWNFWNIQWWTIGFLMMGAYTVWALSCCGTTTKKKKR